MVFDGLFELLVEEGWIMNELQLRGGIVVVKIRKYFGVVLVEILV